MRDRRAMLQSVLATTTIGTLSGCIGSWGDAAEPIEFGAVLPQSGSLERIGTHQRRAIEQAVKHVNTAGGIRGRQINLTTLNSEADPETAVEQYQQLVDRGIVGFVGGLTSGASIALAPNAAEDQIMEVSPSSTSPQLSTAGRAGGQKYFARTVQNDALQASVMAKIIDSAQYADADTVALLALDNTFGDNLSTVISDKLDATVVADVRYDPTADTFDDVFAEVFANSPDVVGFVSVSGQESNIMDAYATTEYDAPWVFSTGIVGENPPSYYDGFYAASIASTQTDGYERLRRLLSDISPLAAFSANAYDALFLMAIAAEKAGEISGTAIADNIRSVSGGAGHTVSVGGFDKVRSLVEAGRELNYQGAASAVDLTPELEPLGSFVIEQVEDGRVRKLELIQPQFFQTGESQ